MSEERKIRLYLAVLNHGWLRRELVQTVLPQMQSTPGVELVLEPFHKTWAQPIFDNRNRIVKRFLETDCDFLCTIDCDVVPLVNPAELVFANKDVIGMPAKVRQHGRAINWVAYVEHPKHPGFYAPVDFSRVDDSIDLLKVDTIGTGCIVIRRNVLEQLKGKDGAFTVEVDGDGIVAYGTDFAFCRRVKAAGFEIYTTPQRICEHFKEVGLLEIQSFDDSDNRDVSAGKYEIPWGEWSIAQLDWTFIRDILYRKKIKNVLEFGSGLSSLLISEIVEVVSYETDEEYGKEIEKRKTPENRLEIRYWDGATKPSELDTESYDLIFVDGPPGKCAGGIGREHSIRIASEIGDRIILHDAGRNEELHWQKIFLKGEFQMVARNGLHQARCQYWERREDSGGERVLPNLVS
jgi:hypothetical protein